jgi:hypothetical protein
MANGEQSYEDEDDDFNSGRKTCRERGNSGEECVVMLVIVLGIEASQGGGAVNSV